MRFSMTMSDYIQLTTFLNAILHSYAAFDKISANNEQCAIHL